MIEIFATNKSGISQRAKFVTEPFVIGSDANANLCLNGNGVMGAHVRLLLTQEGEVLVTNLAPPNSTLMDGKALGTFKPTEWNTGQLLKVGDYELRLVIDGVGASAAPSTASSSKLFSSQTVMPNALPVVEDFDTSPMESIRGDEVESTKPRGAVSIQANPYGAVSDYTKPHDATEMYAGPYGQPAPREHHTEMYSGPFAEGMSADPYESIENTMPKRWQTAGLLAAQLTITQVQLTPGERVRVPLSLRNDYPHRLSLQTLITGIDESWVKISEPTIVLQPREVKLVDIVFYVPPPIYQDRAEVNLLLVDVNMAEIRMNLSLYVVFKKTADLIGTLQPTTLRDGGTTYLRLQNHTQGVARVFIAGNSPTPRLRVLPQQTEIHLPPGQTAQVPIKFKVERRPLFAAATQTFSVSAQQGTRAPLDYPGKVRLRPHMSCLTVLFLLLLIGAVIGAAYLRFGNVLADGSLLNSILPDQSAGVVETETVDAEIEETPRRAPTKGADGLGDDEEDEDEADTVEVEPVATEEAAADDVSIGDFLPVGGDEPDTSEVAAPVETEEAQLDVPDLSVPEPDTPVPTSTPVPPTLTPVLVATPAFVDPRPAGCAVEIPAGWTPYTVRSGDNLFRLGLNHGTTVDEIIRVNCMTPPSYLITGHVILLPNQ